MLGFIKLGWTDPHGSDAAMKMRKKVKERLSQKAKLKVGVRGVKYGPLL